MPVLARLLSMLVLVLVLVLVLGPAGIARVTGSCRAGREAAVIAWSVMSPVAAGMGLEYPSVVPC